MRLLAAHEDIRPAGMDWALEKSCIEPEAHIAKTHAAIIALHTNVEQLLAAKDNELQEELAAFAERKRPTTTPRVRVCAIR